MRTLYLLFVLSLIGTYVAMSLSISHIFGFALPCGSTNGCSIVAFSKTSSIYGIPISIFGFIYYVLSTVVSGMRLLGHKNDRLSVLMTWASLAAMLISVLLSLYMLYRLQSVCVWCYASALCSCLLSALWPRVATGVVHIGRARTSMILVPLSITIAASAFTVVSRAGYGQIPDYDKKALASVSIEDLIPREAISFGSKRPAQRVVVFMDSVCLTCLDAVPRLIERARTSEEVQLIIRNFSPDSSPESMQRGALVEASHELGKLSSYLKELLSDAISGGKSQVAAWEKSVGRPVVILDSHLERARRDAIVARRIRIDSSPFIVLVSGGERRAMSVTEAITRLENK